MIQQCLAKAPASRLRAVELASRLRELQPALAGLPPLDIGDPLAAAADEPPVEATPTAAVHAGTAGRGPAGSRTAVPLVRGSAPDSERATHTRMRVPDADELAGGAHGTARVVRAPGQPRAGSAKHHAAARRRRRLAITAAGLVGAGAVAGWLLLSGGGDGGGSDDGHAPGVVEIDEPGVR